MLCVCCSLTRVQELEDELKQLKTSQSQLQSEREELISQV